MKLLAPALVAAALLSGCAHQKETTDTVPGPIGGAVQEGRHPTGHYPRGGVVPTTAGQDVTPYPVRGHSSCTTSKGQPC